MRKISILLIVGLLAFACKKEVKQTENLPDKTEQLILKNDSLEKEIVFLKSLNDSLINTSQVTENYWFNKDFNGSHFTRQGITNPEEFV
jgi:hypothetical protein